MLPKDYLDIHHDDSQWYICLAQKNNGEWEQHMYHISQIRQMTNDDPRLNGLNKYYGLNAFYCPSRKGEDVRHIRALYADLDCYNVGLKPHEVAKKLQEEYFEKKIPTPNVITFTGRGVNCVWWIQHAPKGAIKSWSRMNNFIFEQLKPLGADSTCASDVSRVFRIPGSINSKTNEKVQAFIRRQDKYHLGTLLEEWAPWNTEKREKQAAVKKKRAFKSRFTLKTLANARIKDLETLQYLRNRDGVVDGYREIASFLYFYNKLCLVTNEEAAFNEVLAYNKSFIKPLNQNELIGNKKYIEEKAEEWKIAYNLKEFKRRENGEINRHGLIFSNKKIIELLKITDDEQQFMTTIIGEEEYKRRERIRQATNRRKNGQAERKAYLQAQKQITDNRLLKVKELIEKGYKQKQIVEELGLSKGRVSQLVKQLKKV
ncbi:hypothetical protein ACP059_21050 (plasmid) [Bacillus cabrialesii]|uniref:hypothetical protein n=1 Tax=Bacillus cabrialesii TaxID=2487276 RepID=UPI003CF93C02